MTLDAFLARFDRKTPTAGQWLVRCPGHEDQKPSLAVRAGDKGIVLDCKAGCSTEKILRVMSLTFADLFSEPQEPQAKRGRVAAEYDYRDEKGAVVHRTIRYEPKGFSQCRPDGRGGWIPNLDGVRRVVYRLPDLQGKEAVIVVEGEKDADRLWQLKLPATCNVAGASSSDRSPKWTVAYSHQLKAAGIKRARIIPDNDAPGRLHAEAIARSCLSAGLSDVAIVALPGVPPKGDVSDYLTDHSRDDLLAVLRDAPLYVPTSQPTEVTVAAGLSPTPLRPVVDAWPKPLNQAAFFGVFGDIVRALEPDTEADSAALLIQQLVMFGSVIGRSAHFRAEADRHYLNMFAVMVGVSAKGRKGVSTGRARGIYAPVDPGWAANCQKSGLSSGEGLIWAVRDQIEKQNPVKKNGIVTEYQTVIEDPGVADKRLLVIEPELASTLRVLSREGNTLSALLRQAWDCLDLRVLTKNSPAKATAPHVSIIGNITCDELRRYLDATEAANGFGNRFLWVCVRRSKLLPDGGGNPDLERFVARIRQAVDFTRGIGEMRRDDDASRLWHRVYGSLSAGRPGLLGAMTGRAEAQVMRLACLYALSDLSAAVRLPHLEAALDVWRYCFASARYIFGQNLGDPVADEILRAGRASAEQTLTRSEVSGLFGRNRTASDIGRALVLLESAQLAKRQPIETGGRPAEAWRFDVDDYEKNEISHDAGGDLSFNSFISYPERPIPVVTGAFPDAVEVEEL